MSSDIPLDSTSYASALPEDDSPVETATPAPGDTHLLLHTGGSTGTPKEMKITHRGIVWNSLNTITAWGLREDDVTPMVFPMFHTGGWNVLTVPLWHMGGTVVIAREFDPGDVLETIDAEGGTVLVAVPAVLRMMSQHDRWDSTDLSTLRFAKSGGGPCRKSVMETWWDRGVDLSQGYGLTECGPNNFAMPEGRVREKSDSIGVPAMHVDARIVDEDGKRVQQGEVGELGARLQVLNDTLEDAETRMDDLASQIVQAVNDIHNDANTSPHKSGSDNAYEQDGTTAAGDFFTPGNTTAASIQVHQDIQDDPTRIAASDTSGETGNNQVALAIGELRNTDLTGLGSESANNFASNLLSDIGSKVQSAKTRSEAEATAADHVKALKDGTEGVSLNEEMTNLIEYQQAFAASARIVQNARQMSETLMSI
jgi:hypothetical protein